MYVSINPTPSLQRESVILKTKEFRLVLSHHINPKWKPSPYEADLDNNHRIMIFIIVIRVFIKITIHHYISIT